jgi:hypothetical protein
LGGGVNIPTIIDHIPGLGMVASTDGDDLIVTVELDTDDDGITDNIEIELGRNPYLDERKVVSVITNNYLLGESDADGDGIADEFDPDIDGDGIPNLYEVQNGLDPFNAADAQQDNDGDGLTNLEEYRHGSDINKTDTDGDGMADGIEVAQGRNPAVDERAVVPVLNAILLGD